MIEHLKISDVDIIIGPERIQVRHAYEHKTVWQRMIARFKRALRRVASIFKRRQHGS